MGFFLVVVVVLLQMFECAWMRWIGLPINFLFVAIIIVIFEILYLTAGLVDWAGDRFF